MKKAILLTILAFFIIQPILAFAFTPTHLFTDQEKDFETGLYNYGSREYDPNFGRFIQQDPVLKDGSLDAYFLNSANQQELSDFLSNPQNLNTYSYTRNNPVNYVDPRGEQAMPYDLTTDIYFFDQDLSDYYKDKTVGNAISLGLDTLCLLPLVPGGLGNLSKNFIKGINYFRDWYKEVKIFKNAEKLKHTLGLANFSSKEQLLENYVKHKGSLANITLQEFSNKAQDLYKRFSNKDKNILSGFKDDNTVLFDTKTNEFSVITKDKVIKTFFVPNVRDKLEYFKKNIIP